MTRREQLIAGAAFGVLVSCALFLNAWGSLQRLGPPGVKVGEEPIPVRDLRQPGSEPVTWLSNSVALPSAVLDYQSELLPVDTLVWNWLPKDTTYGQRRFFRSRPDEGPIQYMVVLMGTDRTSIHQPQYCLEGSGWGIVASSPATVRISRPHPYDLPVMKLITHRLVKDAQGHPVQLSGVFLYWFVSGDELTADHRHRMSSMARQLIRSGVLQRWAYVVCFAPCLPGQEDATFNRLKEFLAVSVPEYQLTAGPRVD